MAIFFPLRRESIISLDSQQFGDKKKKEKKEKDKEEGKEEVKEEEKEKG